MANNNDNGVIRWEEPPDVVPRGPALRPWSLVAAQLRGRPGEFALIAVGTEPSLAARINKGVTWWGPAGSYEATTRLVDGRLCTWARYVGPGGLWVR